jgi:TolB-like protein/Tfp pilus assembly protein PilF
MGEKKDIGLDIRTLGGLAVTAAGEPLRLPTKKTLMLAVAVAMAPGMTASRDRLVGLLWSDRSEAQARGSLRHALAALRKALPDPSILLAPSGSVGLDPEKTQCDASEFLKLASNDAAKAAELYRGPFLADSDMPDPAFEDWALAERRSLHAAALSLVDDFDPSAASPDERQAVAALAGRLLETDPACEEALRALIRRDLAEGRRNAALRRFEQCRDALKAALGVEPEEMTRALIDDPAPAPATVTPPAIPVADVETDHPSIVVLPFKNLSSDPEQGFFADGVVEEITSVLSRIRDFFVIARQTAETLRDSTLDTREIGRTLGVRYILEGAVRRSGDRARITVALIDAGTGAQIWSDRFDGDVKDVFDFQDEVATSVAGALHPSLRQAEIERALRKRPENLHAHDLILRAYPHFWAHTKADNAKATELFEQALEVEPDNALATAMLAWCRVQNVAYMWSNDPETDKTTGVALARKAVGMSDDDPSTMVATAAALTISSADFALAQTLLERSLEIDPNNAWGWMRLGWLYHYDMRTEEAIAAFDRALRLSPYDPFAFNILVGAGVSRQIRGDYAEAVKFVEAGLRSRPSMLWAYRGLASTAASAGDMDKARVAMRKLLEAYPDLTISSLMKAVPMSVQRHKVYWEGLRKAGLPEE